MNKAPEFKLISFIVVIVALIMMLLNSVLTIFIFDMTKGFQTGDLKSLSITGLKTKEAIIPKEIEIYSSSENMFNAIPMSNNISQEKKTQFIQKLIKQYLITRYTINGNQFLMNKNMGEMHLKHKKGCPRKLVSPIYMWSMTFSDAGERKYPSVLGSGAKDDASQAWIEFLEKEVPDIKSKMNAGITRSVEILQVPYKDGDWWKTKIRLIYRNDIEFTREVYEDFNISMEVIFAPKDKKLLKKEHYPFRLANLAESFGDPYIMFGFHVIQLVKEKE
ncbi:MAG: hypothetical protein N4A44_02185 [Alphaproteobacteria bacterium]|jgi:hypothetical protein|nr:hypothetical protein [Alphaproteobacteria bacterium]